MHGTRVYTPVLNVKYENFVHNMLWMNVRYGTRVYTPVLTAVHGTRVYKPVLTVCT